MNWDDFLKYLTPSFALMTTLVVAADKFWFAPNANKKDKRKKLISEMMRYSMQKDSPYLLQAIQQISHEFSGCEAVIEIKKNYSQHLYNHDSLDENSHEKQRKDILIKLIVEMNKVIGVKTTESDVREDMNLPKHFNPHST